MSFPKSGRTWLSYLYVYYCVFEILGDGAQRWIEDFGFSFRPSENTRFRHLFDETGDRVGLPQLQFSHALSTTPYYHNKGVFRPPNTKSLLFLARDPRDVVVSYYFHARTRGLRTKPRVPFPPDVDLSEFIRSEYFGIRPVITYYNTVIACRARYDNFLVVYFEEMKTDASRQLTTVLRFHGVEHPREAAIEFAVQQASFDTLRAREIRQRARRGRTPDEKPLRVRRGQTGGFAAELSEEDVEYLERVIRNNLTPALERYRRPG